MKKIREKSEFSFSEGVGTLPYIPALYSLQYEAEIAYLEGRSREDESRLAHVSSEIERHEKLAQQIDQEVTADLSFCLCFVLDY